MNGMTTCGLLVVGLAISTVSGTTWTDHVVGRPHVEVAGIRSTDDPPAQPAAFGLELTPDGDGVLATWLEPDGDDTALRVARWSPGGDDLDSGGWSEARTVTSRDDLFANWADRPAVRRLADGSLLSHHLQHISTGTYAYGVRLSRSTDDGRTWTDLGWLHDDDRAVEHGFVSMQPTSDGIVAVWLDGRAMPEQKAGDDHGHGGHGHGGGDMSIRTATLGNASFGQADFTPEASRLLDGRTCECCDTDLALTSAGPVVVYRDRAADEARDISIVRRIEESWTAPLSISKDDWRIEGCPVNGPEVAAAGDRVVVAWFTAGPGDADEPRPPRVLVATSDDAGATFSSPMVISESTLGRVDLAMLPGGDAVVCWVDLEPFEETNTGEAAGTPDDGVAGSIMVRRVRRDGTLGPIQPIASMDLGRRAGFPRLAILPPDERTGAGADMLVAWRDETNPGLRTLVTKPPR